MRQHLRGRPRPQHIDVVDVGAADHQGVHEGQQLAARQRTTDPAGQLHGVVDEAFQAQTDHQHTHQDQARVGHEVVVVEDRLSARDHMRRWTH